VQELQFERTHHSHDCFFAFTELATHLELIVAELLAHTRTLGFFLTVDADHHVSRLATHV
jgi:hypothetical protein